jgi:hypothetical protein
MSELGEKRWAVMSERGREATRIAHAEAIELVRRLRAEKLSGLCVITEHAASRLPPARKNEGGAAAGSDNSKRPRRPAKKKSAT